MTDARPTMHNGMLMRSRNEAGYAMWLDRMGFKWEYEPNAFCGKAGQYLPDFVVRNVRLAWWYKPSDVYIEVKHAGYAQRSTESASQYEDRITPLMNQMSVIWDSDPQAVLLLEHPRKRPPIETSPITTQIDRFADEWCLTTLQWGSFVGDDADSHPMLTIAEDWPWQGEWWKVLG